ncbi:MAG: hypothetical protein Q9226_007441 [Calogaya cf. arnoldii]
MSLLYGEGSRAFIRLQREIIRNSGDESIFAWYSEEMYSGMLAERPSAFAGCGNHFPYEESKFIRTPYAMTNRGLSLDAMYRRTAAECRARLITQPLNECILLPLNCTSKHTQERPFTIILQRVSPDVYYRYLAGELVDFDMYCKHLFERTERAAIYIRNGSRWENDHMGNRYSYWSRFAPDQFRGKIYDGLVIIDRHSLGCHATDEWFVTPPGRIESPNPVGVDDWKLRLSGWSGFAVVTLKDTDGHPFRITITYGHTASYATAFLLHVPGYDTMAEIIETCFDQLEERKSSLDVRGEYTLPIGEGKVVALKQHIIEEKDCCYTLAISSV